MQHGTVSDAALASSILHLSTSVSTIAFASVTVLGHGNDKKSLTATGHFPATTNLPSQELL